MACPVLHRPPMEEGRASTAERVTGRIGPETPASATGTKVAAAFSGPVEYEGYQRDEMRHAWTLNPDPGGRYHAVTLHRGEDDPEAWEITADQPFATLDEARAWATRLLRETE